MICRSRNVVALLSAFSTFHDLGVFAFSRVCMRSRLEDLLRISSLWVPSSSALAGKLLEAYRFSYSMYTRLVPSSPPRDKMLQHSSTTGPSHDRQNSSFAKNAR